MQGSFQIGGDACGRRRARLHCPPGMAILRTKSPRRRPAEALRRAVDCLPVATREAMLDSLQSERIVTGAYATQDGGVCPMLAAHRRGGRTSLASFARAWDRYTGAQRPGRPATEREVRTLEAMLLVSLGLDFETGPFADAVRDHQRLVRGRFEREARRGDAIAPPEAAPVPRRLDRADARGALSLLRELEEELAAPAD